MPRPYRSHRVAAAAADRAARHLTSRLAPLVTPWLAAAGLLGAGALTHALWGAPHRLPWAVAGLTLSATGSAWLAWQASHERSQLARAHATVTAAAAGAWLTIATITGPLARPTVDLLAWAGGTLAASWSLRRAVRWDAPQGPTGRRWQELAERIGLGGSRWRTLARGPHREVARLELEPGTQTPADVQARRDRIASALGVPPAGVRVLPDPDRGDRAVVTIVHRDLLRQPVPWPGMPQPAASVGRAPVTLGVYEDGEPVRLALPGQHLLVTGMTGSGKSYAARVLLLDLAARPDVVLWAADTVKQTQTLGPLAPALDWLAVTRRDAEAMLAALGRVIPARAAWLGQRGLDRWEPGCGIPYLVVLIEEAPSLIRDSEQVIDLAQTARSAGVSLILSMQRASWRNIPIDARAQLGAGLCFGVKTAQDAAWTLGDDLVDQGADPSVWGQRRPGYAYLVAAGIPEDRQAVPLRAYLLTPEQARAAAHAIAASGPAELDALSTHAAGPAYAHRHQPGRDPAATPPTARQPRAETATDPGDREDLGLPPDPEPDLGVSLDDPIPDPEPEAVLPFGQPPRRLTPEQARAALARQLDAWAREGRITFAPRDLYPLVRQVGRSRAWIHGEIKRLMAEGRITAGDDPGAYQLHPLATTSP